MRKNIEGEECVSGKDATKEFFCNVSALGRFIKAGIPHIHAEDAIWFPVERCRKWFAGEKEQ